MLQRRKKDGGKTSLPSKTPQRKVSLKQVAKKKSTETKTITKIKKPRSSAPRSESRENKKRKTPGKNTSDIAPENRHKGQKQVPKIKQAGVRTVGNAKKPRLSQQQQNHQVSKNKRPNAKTVRIFKKPKLSAPSSELRQNNKSPKTSMSNASSQHQHNHQKQVSRNKPTGTRTARNFKKPRLAVSSSESCGDNKRKSRGASTSGTAPQRKHNSLKQVSRKSTVPKVNGNLRKQRLQHQHIHEEEMPKNDNTEIGTVGNFLAPILPTSRSEICEYRNPMSPGPSTSNISSLASRSEICDYRNFMSPGPSTSNFSSLIPAPGMRMRKSIAIAPGMRMRKSTAVAPAAIVPETFSNKRNEIPAHGMRIRKSTAIAPGMRMRKSTAVAPAAIVPETFSNKSNENERRTGFDRNLKPLRIVKMAEINGELFFMMKWKDCVTMDLVPVKTAKERCPQVVIQFYESKLLNVFCSSTA